MKKQTLVLNTHDSEVNGGQKLGRVRQKSRDFMQSVSWLQPTFGVSLGIQLY